MFTRFLAGVLDAIFAFGSGVVRSARIFHPDGYTFFGTTRGAAVGPPLSLAAATLEGRVLLRIGMGVVKRAAPPWVKGLLPDAPSVALRFSASRDTRAISRGNRGPGELDILFTAGGDRLWKLLLNLATGGWFFGLNKFDYFANTYFAQVPYRLPDGGTDIWLRLVAAPDDAVLRGDRPKDAEARDRDLQTAAARGAEFVIEAQHGEGQFIPVALVRFDEQVDIDQEALRFQPFGGRGLQAQGFLTTLRQSVYPASAHARPANREERAAREKLGFFVRLLHSLGRASSTDKI